jgi:hypothetical protein
MCEAYPPDGRIASGHRLASGHVDQQDGNDVGAFPMPWDARQDLDRRFNTGLC